MPDKLAVWLAGLPALMGRTLEADKHRGGNPPAIRAGLNRVHTARAGEYTKNVLKTGSFGNRAEALFLLPEGERGTEFVNKVEILWIFHHRPLESTVNFLYNATTSGRARKKLKHNERTETNRECIQRT